MMEEFRAASSFVFNSAARPSLSFSAFQRAVIEADCSSRLERELAEIEARGAEGSRGNGSGMMEEAVTPSHVAGVARLLVLALALRRCEVVPRRVELRLQLGRPAELVPRAATGPG
jgi:hypothetical protein